MSIYAMLHRESTVLKTGVCVCVLVHACMYVCKYMHVCNKCVHVTMHAVGYDECVSLCTYIYMDLDMCVRTLHSTHYTCASPRQKGGLIF